MSGAHLADLAQQAIAGQTAANRARHDIAAGHADPDLLHDRVRAVLATGEPERLRAFCRTVQSGSKGPAMPEKETAARDCNREAAQEAQLEARIIPPLGNCINCGQHIRLTRGVTTCPTCSAWRRWYIAHRIASQALREAIRDA